MEVYKHATKSPRGACAMTLRAHMADEDVHMLDDPRLLDVRGSPGDTRWISGDDMRFQ